MSSTTLGTFTSRDLEHVASETFSIEETETREIESFAIALIQNKMYHFFRIMFIFLLFSPFFL